MSQNISPKHKGTSKVESLSGQGSQNEVYFFGTTRNTSKRPKKLNIGSTDALSTNSQAQISMADDLREVKARDKASHSIGDTADNDYRSRRIETQGTLSGPLSLMKTRMTRIANHQHPSRPNLKPNLDIESRGQPVDYNTKESFISASSGVGLSSQKDLRQAKRSVPNLLISNKVGIMAKSKSRPANGGSDYPNLIESYPNIKPSKKPTDFPDSLPILKVKDASSIDAGRLGSLERVVTHLCNSKYLDELEARQKRTETDVFLTAAPLGVSSAHQLRRLVDQKRLIFGGIEQAASKVSVSKKMNAPKVMERWLSPGSTLVNQPQSFLKDLSSEDKSKAHIHASLKLLNPKRSAEATGGKSTGGFTKLAEHQITKTSSTKQISSPKVYVHKQLKTEVSQQTLDMYKGTTNLISIREVDTVSPTNQSRMSRRVFGSMSPKLRQLGASPKARRMLDSPKASHELSKGTSHRSKDQLKALHDPSYFKYINTVEQRQQRNLMTIRLNATATLLKKMYQQYRVEGQQMLAHLNEEEIRRHARKMEKVLRERRFKDRDLACTQFGQAIHEQNEKLEEMIQFLHEKYKPALDDDLLLSPLPKKKKKKLRRDQSDGQEDNDEQDDELSGLSFDEMDGDEEEMFSPRSNLMPPKGSGAATENSFFKSEADDVIPQMGATQSITASGDSKH